MTLLAAANLSVNYTYRIVASTGPSRFEAHAGLFRLLMHGIFDAYVLLSFDKSFVFELETQVNTRDFTSVNCCRN